jgi:hypothetical protein
VSESQVIIDLYESHAALKAQNAQLTSELEESRYFAKITSDNLAEALTFNKNRHRELEALKAAQGGVILSAIKQTKRKTINPDDAQEVLDNLVEYANSLDANGGEG